MALAPRLRYSPHPAIPLSVRQLEVRDRVIERMHRGSYPTEAVPCPCGAPPEADLILAERDRYGLPVCTALCGACGLVRTTPRLTAEATARFYEEDYRDLYTGEAIGAAGLYENQRARGRARCQRLGKLVAQAESVYEVGCGAGGLLEPFREIGKRVAGVDLGSEYLAYGRARGLDLVQGDAADLLAHTGEPADLVFLVHVLEHMLDLPTELERLWHLVRPGGVLVVEVPGLQSIETGYRGDFLLYLQNAHTYHFCAQTLEDTLSAAGFDVAYVDESATALALRPEADATPQRRPIAASPGTARRVLHDLAELEMKLAQSAARAA